MGFARILGDFFVMRYPTQRGAIAKATLRDRTDFEHKLIVYIRERPEINFRAKSAQPVKTG